MLKNLNHKISILIKKYEYKQFQQVIDESIVILKKNDNDFLWNLTGLSFQNLFKIKKSIDCFENALKINSKNFSALNNLGLSYKMLKDYSKAEEYLLKAKKINPKYVNALVNLGNIKNDTYHLKDALFYYQKALKLNKNLPIINFNISNIYRSTNKINEAKKYLDDAIKLDEKFTMADQKLTLLEKYTKDNPHIKVMLNKLEKKELSNNQKAYLQFGLIKVYRDINDFEKSIFHLIEANKTLRALIKYDIQIHKSLSNKIKSFFSKIDYKKYIQSGKGKGHIFILGMPRSGTSLVEKIVSSHSKVSSISEANFIPEKIYENINKGYESFIDFLKSDFESQYKSFLKAFNIKNNIILDKTLTNFWYVGFIKIFLPEAKIIHISRNPKDNCLSIFENMFDIPEGWNSDQRELAEYYLIYTDIMKYWNSFFKDDLINIKYENLVLNSNTEIKHLIKKCDLNWEVRCLEYYKSENPIKTVSFNQANTPIYKTSIEKYKVYEKKLNNLFSKLN